MAEEKLIEMEEYEEEQLDDVKQLAAKYGVQFPDGILPTKLAEVRRPLMLVRGKPITVRQVMELITGEEPLFREGFGKENNIFDPRNGRGVLKNIFYRQGYKWLSTWVYSDGTVGGDLITLERYPHLYELLPPYLHLARTYPFLDMVISWTTYDECCCFGCDVFDSEFSWYHRDDCKCRDCEPYMDRIVRYSNEIRIPPANLEELRIKDWEYSHVRSDVGDSVQLTIWIHYGETQVLFGEKAIHKFNEYHRLYCDHEYAFLFASEIYKKGKTCICSKTFVEDCFEYMGKPRNLCDEYVARGFLSPFDEREIVVTKKWMADQCAVRQY